MCSFINVLGLQNLLKPVEKSSVVVVIYFYYCNKTSYYYSIGYNRFCLCFASKRSHNILSYDTNNENPGTGSNKTLLYTNALDIKYAKICPLLCCYKLTNYTKDFLILQLGHQRKPL